MKTNTLRHLLSIILLPGMVLIVIPVLILGQNPQINFGWGLPFPWNVAPVLAGFLLLIVGLALLFQTIALFRSEGEGTIAPWDPTGKLVVRGPYRYVRNPMISGVLLVLLAEAILLGSKPLLIYFVFAALLNAIYIPLSEEPGMERRFGADYISYKQNVPRWIPRLKPWEGKSR